jgi:hypothetical protein
MSLFLLLSACREQTSRQDKSFIHSFVDTLAVNKDKNLLIYSLNHNDCINCLYGFVQLYNATDKKNNTTILILPVDREIEKKEILSTTKNISLYDSVNKVVIWDKLLFSKLNEFTGHTIPVSLITIYNYEKDSILFCRPVKELQDPNEVLYYLESE